MLLSGEADIGVATEALGLRVVERSCSREP
jgi:hypothetical protein